MPDATETGLIDELRRLHAMMTTSDHKEAEDALWSITPAIIAELQRLTAIEAAAKEVLDAKNGDGTGLRSYLERLTEAEAALAAALSPHPATEGEQ